MISHESRKGVSMRNILDEYGIDQDPRFAQCFREAAISLLIYALHMSWTIGLAYGIWFLGDQGARVFGLPAYLFWSVIVSSLFLILLVWLVTRYYYKDMPLDDD